MRLTATDGQEAWRLLLIGQSRLREYFAARIRKQFRLSPAQFEALMVLLSSPNQQMTMSHLSHSLLYSSGSATNLVARLEQLGYVARTPGDTDHRVVEVGLTTKGAELIQAARKVHFADLDRVFSPLVSAEELPHLVSLAKRMMAAPLDEP
jgi:DNA-binding MarR family transcriptional regulator